MTSRRTAVLVCLIAAAGLVGVGFWLLTDSEGEEKFCTAGLSIRDVGGTVYVIEDQGSEGRDGCDIGDGALVPDPYEHGEGFGRGYIGYDCRLHVSDDEVSDDTIVQPNRSDGTCGQGPPWEPS